jgi:hypothetical protein
MLKRTKKGKCKYKKSQRNVDIKSGKRPKRAHSHAESEIERWRPTLYKVQPQLNGWQRKSQLSSLRLSQTQNQGATGEGSLIPWMIPSEEMPSQGCGKSKRWACLDPAIDADETMIRTDRVGSDPSDEEAWLFCSRDLSGIFI